MTTPATIVTGGVLGVGGVIGLAISYIAYQHRDHPAAGPLSKLAAIPGVAALGYAAIVAVPDSPATVPLLVVANGLLIPGVGYFLLFTLVYTGHGDMLTARRRRAIVALFWLCGIVGGVRNAWLPVSVETVNGLTLPVVAGRTSGPLFAVLITVIYLSVFAGLALLGRFLISPRNMYRKQTAVVIAAIAVTLVGNMIVTAGLQPHPGLELTAVFYVVEVALIALALFRYEFLNVEPLAPGVVLERMDDPVVVLDERDVVVDTNPAARRLLDVSDPVGTPVNDLLPGLLGAAAKDEEYVLPGQPRESGGAIDVYDLNAAPIRDQYDRDRGTVVVLRDVSVQKQRERTLERLQTISQRFLAAETEQEVVEIAVTAADELLEYPYSGAMLYDEEAEVLRPTAFADPLAAAFEGADLDRDPVVGPGDSDVWAVFETGEPMLGDPLDTPDDGPTLPVDIGGSLIYPLGDHGVLGISAGPDHDGFSDDDRRFAATLASTTENALDRVAKEREVRESRELLATRNEQIEFFNSVLRHDLLNGMQVVQGHVEVLSDRVDEEASVHVEVIDDWITDIVALTQNVRAVTGAVSGESRVDLKPVDLGPALSKKVAKVRDSHDGVTVDFAADPGGLPAVRADDFLPEVFENLLGNAVEHNDREHTEITIDVEVDAAVATVRIADNGPGIPDEQKETIFEESVTSAESGSIGFGLYFVRVMVDRYGGDVWFEDRADWPAGDLDGDADPEEGRGAVAVVQLSLADVAAKRPGTGTSATDD